MTVYMIDCSHCARVIKTPDGAYCVPMPMGNKACHVEPGHAGTKEDPDPIVCEYYMEEVKE